MCCPGNPICAGMRLITSSQRTTSFTYSAYPAVSVRYHDTKHALNRSTTIALARLIVAPSLHHVLTSVAGCTSEPGMAPRNRLASSQRVINRLLCLDILRTALVDSKAVHSRVLRKYGTVRKIPKYPNSSCKCFTLQSLRTSFQPACHDHCLAA